MDRYKIVAIMGKSASGKDTILNRVMKMTNGEYNRKVSTTTRPPREGEEEGVDYYFTTAQEFAQKILDYDMIEANEFNDWFYGTEIKALDKDVINIGIFNPDGIRALKEDSRVDLLVIYIVTDDKTRLIRSLQRESEPDINEVFRRYKADETDFSDIDFSFHAIYNNEHYTVGQLAFQVHNKITEWSKTFN